MAIYDGVVERDGDGLFSSLIGQHLIFLPPVCVSVFVGLADVFLVYMDAKTFGGWNTN